MAALKRLLHIKSEDEVREEVKQEPHVEEARKTLTKFYTEIQGAENALTYRGRERRRHAR